MESLVLFAVLYLTHAAGAAPAGALNQAFLGAIRAGRREETLTLISHLDGEITCQSGAGPLPGRPLTEEEVQERRRHAAAYLRDLYQDAADRGEEYRVVDGRVETFWKSGPWAEVA